MSILDLGTLFPPALRSLEASAPQELSTVLPMQGVAQPAWALLLLRGQGVAGDAVATSALLVVRHWCEVEVASVKAAALTTLLGLCQAAKAEKRAQFR